MTDILEEGYYPTIMIDWKTGKSFEESKRWATQSDVLIKNLGAYNECYTMPKRKAMPRYKLETGNIYSAIGEAIAIKVTPEMAKWIGTRFLASWNEPIMVQPGDYIVQPCPNRDEVYVVARMCFKHTYKKLGTYNKTTHLRM